jgi:hypothetical protein
MNFLADFPFFQNNEQASKLSLCLWVTPFQFVSQLTDFLEILYECYAIEEHTKAIILLLSTINNMLHTRNYEVE